MDNRQEAKKQLASLIEDFRHLQTRGGLGEHAEATARTWIERFLVIFGWDPADPSQIRQEYRIRGRAARRLAAEGTRHRRPDYCLLANGRRTLYLDAKKFAADALTETMQRMSHDSFTSITTST